MDINALKNMHYQPFGDSMNDMYRLVNTPKEFKADILMRERLSREGKAIMKARPGKRVPVTEEGTVTWIKNEVAKRRTDRLFLELQWMLNLAFIGGQQYMYINNHINSLFTVPPRFEWQQRDVYNHIAPVYETTMAKYAKINPTFLTNPQSSDINDINAAEVSKTVIKNWLKSEEFEARQLEANAWSAATGTAIWKTIWNPNKGKKIARIQEEDGTIRYVKEGDVENVVVPPFELFPDSSYNYRIEDCRNVIHARPVSIDDIYDTYGVDVLGEDLNIFTFDKGSKSTQGMSSGGNMSARGQENKHDVVMLYEYYENPSTFYPNGRLIVCCDNYNKFLHNGELPYINAKNNERTLPFDIQKDIPKVGYFWGTCRIDRAIPAQRRYNAIKNRMAEYMNRFAIGVYAVPETSTQIDDLEENGLEPGAILTYKQGETPPRAIDSGSLPAIFENEAMNTLGDITKTTGVSELSKSSQAPTGVSSGRAMLVLQDMDETRMSLTAKSVATCQVKVSKKTLYAYKQFATFERMIALEGAGNAQKVIRWKGSSLDPESLYIENPSALSESFAQRRGWILELLQMGAFRDENGLVDYDRVSRMVEFGDRDVAQTPEIREKTRTKEENAYIKMKMFNKVVIDDFEIHDIAIKYHLEYMLSAEYRSDPQEVQQAFKIHLAGHKQAIQEEYMQQIEAQMVQQQTGKGEIENERSKNEH